MKTCSTCKQSFPETEEYFPRRGTGLRGQCRMCRAEYNRRFAAEHKEELQQYQQNYYVQHREHKNEAHRQWRVIHYGEKLAYTRQYYAEHSEEILKQKQEYYSRHKKEFMARNHRRRLKLTKSGGHHTAGDIRIQSKAQTDKAGRLHCWWCGQCIEGENYHVDHRIPLSRGGSNAAENVCIACPHCNLTKYNKLPQEWNGRLL